MIVFALLVLQSGSAGIVVGPGKTTVSLQAHAADDSTRARRDSLRRAAAPARPVITPAILASSYADDNARSLITRARDARLSQDSSIQNYEATTYQRLTTKLGLSHLALDRMLFRYESTSRVRWERGVGASVEITGRRAAAPSIGDAQIDIDDIQSPVPYFPGRDALWAGSSVVKDEIKTDDLVHPLATAAEAYYIYQTGDSLQLRLGDGTTIRLREVLVRPRKVEWRAVVGSLWFDVDNGQLVRAAYKLSEPFDFWAPSDTGPRPPFLLKSALSPASGNITGIAIEYGLHDGKYWLPRSQVFEGNLQLLFVRIPVRIEEHFDYTSVNAGSITVTLPPSSPPFDTSSLIGLDSVARAAARRRLDRARDSLEAVGFDAHCKVDGMHDRRVTRYDGTLVIDMKVPCDQKALAMSPTLPRSIFDEGDSLFTDRERDDLLARAEALMPEPSLGFHPPKVQWNFGMMRFNRIEGLSSGVVVEQWLGRDLSLRAVPRIGVADRILNGELSLVKEQPHSELTLTGYRRLSADTEWGDPLSFGSSVSALLFARDEGMYYRTTGGELSLTWSRAARATLTLYGQNESDAIARNSRSLVEMIGGDGFLPEANITAHRATEVGSALSILGSRGVDADSWRVRSALRLDGARGDFDYARGSADLTVSHSIVGPYSAALTASGGSSLGTVPVQHLYYLGGSSTVRGQTVGDMGGNAYWFGRAEFGKGLAGRRVIFADLGWAGDRAHLDRVGRPMSGVGIGLSVLDGLFRFDVARGIYPRHQFRLTLYMDSKY